MIPVRPLLPRIPARALRVALACSLTLLATASLARRIEAPPTAELAVLRLAGEPQQALAAFEKLGGEALVALPPDAWIVRCRGGERALASALGPSVIELRALRPEERLSFRMKDRLAAAPTPDPVRLWVLLAPGAPLAEWQRRVATIPRVEVLHGDGAALLPTITIRVPGDGLEATVLALAQLGEVLSIEPVADMAPQMESVVWDVQTGDLGTGASDLAVSAKLFARGVTGRGMLLGHVDAGLENDYCPAVYAPRVIDEAAWPLGPSADAADPVPPEQSFASLGGQAPIRTRERKVVAYLVQSGADEHADLHGVTCNGIAVGDDPAALAARPVIRDLGELQDVRPFRADGSWTLGQALRPDLANAVDDPAVAEPWLPAPHGPTLQHHQRGDGIAPGAQVIFQDIGSEANGLETDATPGQLMLQASRMGATTWLAPLSWPCLSCTDCYDSISIAVDSTTWARRDFVVVVPAGNFSMPSTGSVSGGLAQSKNAIVAGGSEHSRSSSCNSRPCPLGRVTEPGHDMLMFSGVGPSSGGRLGPTIVAPGMAQPAASLQQEIPWLQREDGSGSGDGSCARGTSMEAGTSLSTSVVAGQSLLVQQYFMDGYHRDGRANPKDAFRPTNALVRATLVNSARELFGSWTHPAGGQAHRPSEVQGFGSPVLDDTLYFEGDPVDRTGARTQERSRLVVINDVPNGVDGAMPLSREPGGRTRDQIVAHWRPALQAGQAHDFIVPVLAQQRAEDLRFTLSWSDPPAGDRFGRLVNDLDLEVISPGADGILQSATGPGVLGDDVLFRSAPASWAGGYTAPTAAATVLEPGPPSEFAPGRDAVNAIESVFVAPALVVAGNWRIRVVAAAIRGTSVSTSGTPNFVLGDGRITRDTNGDGAPDEDTMDVVRGTVQGYALIASGPLGAPVGSPPRSEPNPLPSYPRSPRISVIPGDR